MRNRQLRDESPVVIAHFPSARIANEPPFVAATAWSPELNLSRHRTSTEGLRPCFEECRGLCRLECVGCAVRDQIVATATYFSPTADLPSWYTDLSEDQQHLLPDIGPNGGLGPQGWQWLPFDVGHVLSP